MYTRTVTKRRPRRRFTRRKPNSRYFIKKAFSQIRDIRRNIANEIKYYDVENLGDSVASDVPIVHWLTGMAQGTTDTTRIGNSVTPYNLFIRLTPYYDQAATYNNASMRIIIFRDNNDELNNVFDASQLSELLTVPTSYQSPLVFNTRGRFKILYDTTVSLSINGPSSLSIKKFIKFKRPKPITYTLAGGPRLNHLYCVFISNQLAASNPPVMDSYFRFKYADA